MPIARLQQGFDCDVGEANRYSSTGTQLISTYIYLHVRTVALAPNHTHTQNPTPIAYEIVFFDVIQMNRYELPVNEKDKRNY